MIEPRMSAVRLHALGDPGALRHERIPIPQPGPGEALVRVDPRASMRRASSGPKRSSTTPPLASRTPSARSTLVFDTVGGERLERSPAATKDGGRLVSIATEPPQGAEERGVTALYFVVKPDGAQPAELATLAGAGRLRVEIDRTYPLADPRQAHERSLARESRGKVVLRIAEA